MVTVDGGFKAKDVVSICGYNPWKVSSTDEHSGDIAASVATGTSKTDYNLGTFTLTADANALYMMRAEGSGTCICAIKVTRPGGDTPSEPISVESVTLDVTSAVMDINDTKQLTATVTPSNATDKTVTWTSSDAAVATVSESGLVTAVGQGSATITATSNMDNTKKATCTVTVNPPAAPIEVESISLKASTTIYIGGTETLSVTYTPDDANTGKAITWTSSNESVAKVDANGKVTAVSAGTATITATSEKGKTAICTVTVQAVAVTGVTLDKNSLSIKETETATLTATVLPANATNRKVTWSSDNTAVATVSASGVVTGVTVGTATITVTTEDGNKTATCNVIVEAKSSLPDVGLKTHTPEIYEDPAGYNTPLAKFKDREYEVYYTAKGKIGGSGSGVPLVYVNKSGNEISTATKAKDGWFEYQINSGDSEDKALTKDEFTVKRGTWKTTTDNYLVMQVKGYDQFRFFAAEKKDSDPNQQLHVFIDDLEHEIDTMKHSTSATIREFNISTDEHVIKITATGSSNQYIYGWSLRVSNEPLVRYLAGPKKQTVYQTKDIERVAFRVRRAASHRISWKNDNAISGVSLVEGTNDSVFVEGLANAAAGTYTYTIEALDNAGEIKSSESGTITIQTHIFDAHNGNNFTTNIDEAIKPVNFLYYAQNSTDIQLHCDLEGLQLTFSKDSIATLTGTPTLNNTEGEHPYTITAAGGNTISGVITLVVPDPIIEPFADAKTRDRMAISFSVTARHAANVTATGLPDGFTVSYEAYSNKATISGTPNIGGGYPKTFNFTLEAAPRYAGKNASTASGKLIVIDPNGKAVLVLSKDIDNVNDDPIAKYLSELHYDITHRKQEVLAGSSYDMFDLILISEDVDADHTEVLDLLQNRVNKPILNMKAFTYTPDRLNWGDPDNGSLTKEGCYITVERDDHPIFQALNKKQGDKIQVLDTIDRKGLMPIRVKKAGSLCLATSLTRNKEDYYGDGEAQTFLHEIPGKLSGSSKYICFPIAKSSSEKLTAEGKRLLEETVKYLLNDMSSVVSPTLEMTRFAVNGIAATPNEANSTFKLEIDTVQYPDIDLTAVVPEIELASPYTHTEPAIGDTIDLSIAQYIPIEYVVTDYITRRVYEISLRLFKPQGIETVYTAGEWVNVYDIYGRKVATTNEDIYAMTLPRGIYIIVTESGQTLKIMK